MNVKGPSVSVAAGLVLIAVLTGCTSGAQGPDNEGGPSPAASQPVVTKAQAEKVFTEYDRVNARADGGLDDKLAGRVQTGVLLKESRAAYRVHRLAKTKDTVVHWTKPRFLIPSVAADSGYPRYFGVLSKSKGKTKDRSSQLFHFVQKQAGARWLAAASTWALTEPLKKPSASSPMPSPTTTEDGKTVVRLRPKQLPDLRRGPGGTVSLADTAEKDRQVCGAFAQYLSFSPPDGTEADARFVKGAFTSDLVKYFNKWGDPRLDYRLTHRTTGMDLPVLRLASGGSLVTCTLEQENRMSGTGSTGTVDYRKGSDAAALIGGSGEWRRATEVSSMTVLVEVPAKGAAATVMACDCYGPQLLSARGDRD